MPYIHVSSNVPKTSVDSATTLQVLSKTVAETMDVQEIYVMAQLDLDQSMIFQATDAPCAMIHFRIIGKVNAERNPKTVKALTATVAEALNVPAGRVFVVVDDIHHGNWGFGGAVAPKLS